MNNPYQVILSDNPEDEGAAKALYHHAIKSIIANIFDDGAAHLYYATIGHFLKQEISANIYAVANVKFGMLAHVKFAVSELNEEGRCLSVIKNSTGHPAIVRGAIRAITDDISLPEKKKKKNKTYAAHEMQMLIRELMAEIMSLKEAIKNNTEGTETNTRALFRQS